MTGLQLLVIRINRDTSTKEPQLVNSKPCINCINYIRSLGIKKIYYSDDQGEIIYEKTREIYTEHISQFRRKLGE